MTSQDTAQIRQAHSLLVAIARRNYRNVGRGSVLLFGNQVTYAPSSEWRLDAAFLLPDGGVIAITQEMLDAAERYDPETCMNLLVIEDVGDEYHITGVTLPFDLPDDDADHAMFTPPMMPLMA